MFIKDGFISQFEKADDNHMFTIGYRIFGEVYVLKKSIIVYVKTGEVRKFLKNINWFIFRKHQKNSI